MNVEIRLVLLAKLRVLSTFLEEWIGREAMLRSRIVLNQCKQLVGETLALVEEDEKQYLENIAQELAETNYTKSIERVRVRVNNMHYEETDGGEALDKIVAEKAGWKAIDLNDNPHGLRVKGPNWRVVGPEGQGASDYLGAGWTPEDAWNKSMFPRYATNANAAQYLIERLPDYLAVHIEFNCLIKIWDVVIRRRDDSSILGRNLDKSLSVAICRAWLGWKDHE